MDKLMPKNIEEYNARYHASTKILGYGAETRTVLPCPFCAAPDWLVFPVTAGLNDYRDFDAPATCGYCKRTAKLLVTKDQYGNVAMELVQLAGDAAPEWLNPKPRVIADPRDLRRAENAAPSEPLPSGADYPASKPTLIDRYRAGEGVPDANRPQGKAQP